MDSNYFESLPKNKSSFKLGISHKQRKIFTSIDYLVKAIRQIEMRLLWPNEALLTFWSHSDNL